MGIFNTEIITTGKTFGEIGRSSVRHVGGFTLSLAHRAGMGGEQQGPVNLTSQALERCMDELNWAESSGFVEIKMDMLRHVARLTADSLQSDGSLSERPGTNDEIVSRGLETLHEHFPNLEGLAEHDLLLDEDRYKVLWSGLQQLPQPYGDWEPKI